VIRDLAVMLAGGGDCLAGLGAVNDKDTGLRNLPFRDFEHNHVWLELVRIAHDLIAWTQRLLLTGELARCEPKHLRDRLLPVSPHTWRCAPGAPPPGNWLWAADLAAAFPRFNALPPPLA
jgi:hypothetical protein